VTVTAPTFTGSTAKRHRAKDRRAARIKSMLPAVGSTLQQMRRRHEGRPHGIEKGGQKMPARRAPEPADVDVLYAY
jgi:hypothetical protein